MRGGDVAVAEVFLEGATRELGPDGRVPPERREFGAEDEGAALGRVEKGFFAEAVAAAEEAAGGAVVDDEGPHAVAAVGQIGAPFAVAVKENFGVGVVRDEAVTAGYELSAELGEIIDLAVENDDVVAVGRDHRLLAAGVIENRQAAVAEMYAASLVGPVAGGVGATLRKSIGHAPQRRFVAWADESGNAAHSPVLFAARIREGRNRAPAGRRSDVVAGGDEVGGFVL